MKRAVREPPSDVPVAAEADVLVAGGGPAGLGAAIAAAREGASTIMVERNSFLGGAATAYLLSKWSQHKRRLYGIAEELVDEMVRRKAAVIGSVINFDPEVFKKVALDFIEASGSRLLLYSWAVKPIVEANTTRGIFVENKSGRQAILAKTTIDCTGDADLACHAGVPFWKGRPSDGKMRPMTLIFRMGNIDFNQIIGYARQNPTQFSLDPNFQVNDIEHGVVRISGFFDLAEQARRSGEVYPDFHYLRLEGVDVERGICFVNSTRVYGVDGTNAWDITRAEIEARKQIEPVANFIRKYIPGCERAFILDTAANIGVRETRRIQGEYILTEEDIISGKAFPDRVVHGYSHLAAPGVEIHSPDRQEGSEQDLHGRVIIHQERSYFIPYRSLLPLKIDGLLIAGRCISQTREADKWTRNEVWCLAMGQAVGTAAAIAAADGISVRQVNVERLQDRLKSQGAPLDEITEQPVPEPRG
jgi:hypothetical protein